MNYKVSKDYPRLKQLMDEGHKIVCWVTYDIHHDRKENKLLETDIMQACKRGEGENVEYAVSVRGYCFLDYHPGWACDRYSDERMFADFETFNLQFIDPDAKRNTLSLRSVCWYEQ